MPSQVVGFIEAEPLLSRSGWHGLVEIAWQEPAIDAELIEADLEQLEADLAEEWAQFHRLRLSASV